jgi:hypothetical protein
MTKILFGILLGLASVYVYHFHPDLLKPILSATRQIAGELSVSKTMEPQQKDASENPMVPIEFPQSVTKPIPEEIDGERPVSRKMALSEEKRSISYPLWRFDTKRAAEGFAKSIEKESGVALKIGREATGYMTYISADDEEEVMAKLGRIQNTSGIIPSRRDTDGENEKHH